MKIGITCYPTYGGSGASASLALDGAIPDTARKARKALVAGVVAEAGR